MDDAEAYDRAREAHKEAWQMALDHNQPADVRREWERKRDEALYEMIVLRQSLLRAEMRASLGL